MGRGALGQAERRQLIGHDMARPTNSSNELILRVRRRDGRQDEIYVAPGLTIGRSVANTVVLAGDSTVDPIQHARAEVNHDGTLCLCCRDPASTILQNGVKVSKVALEPGQQFKIGDTDFECLQATRTDKSGYENLDSSGLRPHRSAVAAVGRASGC